MGAKTWMLVYADGHPRQALALQPQIDRDATAEFAHRLFAGETLEQLPDVDLSCTSPLDDEIHIGCFPDVSVVAAKEFAIDHPSKVPPSFLAAGGSRRVYLHAMHSVVDWFAYAYWRDGQLLRSLSLSPDSGMIEDLGERLSFEEPYWSGEHPAVEDEEQADAYPFPFHPLELGDAALLELFGFQLEGPEDSSAIEPESVPLMRFKRRRSRWKFWR